MPISGLALSRTTKAFTDHLKNFELGTITETNPSDGVYRYTFADNASPYTWSEVAMASGGNNYIIRFGINVGHFQAYNNTGAYSYFSSNGDNNNLHFNSTDAKIDSYFFTSPSTSGRLPSGRNTETTGTFASYLGGSAITYGDSYALNYNTNASRMTSAVTMSSANRYVEINWNTVALNEATLTTSQRNYGRTPAANIKLVFQPYIYFDTLTNPDYAVYYGKPRYFNSTIAGASLATLRSSPPSDISSFNYPGGRVIGWTETNSNFANPYIYLYKWTGSWTYVREGYISDGNIAFDGRANYNTYTVPIGDGTSTYFYIYIYQYDGYYNTFSSAGAGSNYITV